MSSSSLSAAKILERAEDQFHHQLQHMLTDHETLQRRDEIHNKNTGARDTIIPFQLSKWAFLTFLVAGCICIGDNMNKYHLVGKECHGISRTRMIQDQSCWRWY